MSCDRLKYVLVIPIFLFWLFIGFSAEETFAEKTAARFEDTPMAKLMLELYKNKNKDISLGAMLLSVELYSTHNLEKFLRMSIDKNDTKWINCIKLYVISKFTFDDDDVKAFIEAFPDDRKNFWTLINFESNVTRHPHSKMISHLISYAKIDTSVYKNAELKNLAVSKVHKIIPLADGWVSESIESQLCDKE
jgi:hypothetical protein